MYYKLRKVSCQYKNANFSNFVYLSQVSKVSIVQFVKGVILLFKKTFIELCNSISQSPTSVCQALGLSNAAYSKWTDTSIPRETTLKKIADYFGVSVDFLKNSSAAPTSDVVFVPIYGRVSAGTGVFANDEIIGTQPILSVFVKNIGECFCLKVTGDSMLPRISDGDIILVRKQTSVDSGDYAVVLVDDDNGVVKKVVYDADSVTLISINPNYPPRTFSGKDLQRIQVIGKLIQSISTYE